MVLKECGEKNIPAVVIISAGFKEIGDSGKILEDEIVRIAKEYSITLLGPNCNGELVRRPSRLKSPIAVAAAQVTKKLFGSK